MNVRGIDFVCYPVTDLKRSIAFYSDVIGLKLDEVYQDTYAEFDVNGQWFSILAGEPGFQPGDNGGQVAFNVPDLAQAVADLRAKGFEPRGEMETPVCRMAFLADPDGNGFVLHERPRKE